MKAKVIGKHIKSCMGIQMVNRNEYKDPWHPELRWDAEKDIIIAVCNDPDCSARLIISGLPKGKVSK